MTIISVDFKLDDKIIEFDGDYWHSKEEQIIKDKLRDEFLSNKGYLILRIKEFSYRDNKEKVINECLDFLNN
jgi:very-short-patch-repair endonuclease